MDDLFHLLRSIESSCGGNEIFILGKGPSVDGIDPESIAGRFVVGINDAERIAPAEVSVFHGEWVKDSLRLNGYQSELYVTNQLLPESIGQFHAPYVKSNQESSELLVQRFYEDSLYIEDVLIVTALKICRLVAQIRARRQSVYLLGFDFDMSQGFSSAIETDFSGADRAYQASVVSAHEHYLLMFLHLLRDADVHIMHVGDKTYSALSVAEFQARFSSGGASRVRAESHPSSTAVANSDEADSHPASGKVLITAEITTNHFGDSDRLREMVRRSADAGADLVKVQKRDVDSFYTRQQLESPYESPFGTTFGDYRRALELSDEQFEILDEVCNDVGVEWFLSILDLPSFEAVKGRGVNYLKLPSTISQHTGLIEAVAREHRGAVVISTGLTDQAYEDYVLHTFRDASELYLLQCTSAYPAPPEDCNLGVVRHYRDLTRVHPQIRPGYSSHDFGSEGSMLAVAAGAVMVEKHVTLGSSDWAHFDSVALDLGTDAFHTYVRDIRRAELLCGNEQKGILESEHHKYWVRPSG